VIFVGEAEGLWEEFLRGFPAGAYAREYRQTDAPSLQDVPMARKALYHRSDYTSGVLFATRGCPYHCDFCVIRLMYPHGLRKRPITEVAAEYGSFKGKRIIFWDENIAGDREYAKGLFAQSPLIASGGAARPVFKPARINAFLEEAARSGCKQLFLGLESISQSSMDEVGKGFNRVEDYARIVERIHAHGIAVQAGIVFGFDHDTPEIFRDTVDFLERTGFQNATFNILTPYPGTALFRRLESEGRILTRDWRKYNGRTDVVFQPRQMSGEELLAGYRYANQRFYSLASVAKRVWQSRVKMWWALPLNLAYVASWTYGRKGAD
jgi:radical SAM superfamily enzyme YgiQ (UPF0313 family)